MSHVDVIKQSAKETNIYCGYENEMLLINVHDQLWPVEPMVLHCTTIYIYTYSTHIAYRVTRVIQLVSNRRHVPRPSFAQRGGSQHRPLSAATGMHWGQPQGWPQCRRSSHLKSLETHRLRRSCWRRPLLNPDSFLWQPPPIFSSLSAVDLPSLLHTVLFLRGIT